LYNLYPNYDDHRESAFIVFDVSDLIIS